MMPFFMVLLMNGIAENLGDSARIAIFQIVTALTTTGFQNRAGLSDMEPCPAAVDDCADADRRRRGFDCRRNQIVPRLRRNEGTLVGP
jgi:hypothetical protein